MILVASQYDRRPELFEPDYSALDDPRAIPFRAGVECFVCRKPCRVEATCCCLLSEAAFGLWAHRECLQGKALGDVAPLYYDSVREIAMGVSTRNHGG